MISIVVPVFNEEASLDGFYKRLAVVLPKLDKEYETIFIDDGSIDTSLTILKKFATKDSSIRIFSFRRNQGKAEALTYGFQKAKGDYIVTLDADLQDQPEEIKKLLDKAKEGYDVVAAWRKDRKDASKMKIISKLFNLVTYSIWGIQLHDYNAGLKVYSQDAAKSLHLYGGMHRFIPLLAFDEGFSVTELAVSHAPRKFGKSKYGFSKIKDLPDMFTMLFLSKYGKRPLHFFGMIGGTLITIGLMIVLYLYWLHLFGARIGNRPLLLGGFFTIIGGLQIFFTGFLADLLLHISQEQKWSEKYMHHLIKFEK